MSEPAGMRLANIINVKDGKREMRAQITNHVHRRYEGVFAKDAGVREVSGHFVLIAGGCCKISIGRTL